MISVKGTAVECQGFGDDAYLNIYFNQTVNWWSLIGPSKQEEMSKVALDEYNKVRQ